MHKAGAWPEDIINLIIIFFQITPSLLLDMIPKVIISFNSPISLHRYTYSCQCTERGSKQKLILNGDLEVCSGRDRWLEFPPGMNKKEVFWLALAWVTWWNDCHGVAMISEFWLFFGLGLGLVFGFVVGFGFGCFFFLGAKVLDLNMILRSSEVLTV